MAGVLTAALLLAAFALVTVAYDPEDTMLEKVLPPPGNFEAFYPGEAFGVEDGSVRAPHGHASFYKHRNPALVDAKNAAAYGFRFDGGRRFNYD
ncbi:uncharacterized protein [Anabrus simplex]|uniref:uncharacterized protein n=1 Tax=Anabrus simplex TaxID=316456 RepID=UPI0034DCC92D